MGPWPECIFRSLLQFLVIFLSWRVFIGLISPLKNCAWRRSSWMFNWKSLYKKFRRPCDTTCELGHETSSITLFPIVYSLSPVYYNFHSYAILPEFLDIQICVSQRSQESNGVGLRVVMRITPHNYDVTNVCPDSIVCAWQPLACCPWRHLKSNTCVRHNFKHTNFNLFLAILIKKCTGDRH